MVIVYEEGRDRHRGAAQIVMVVVLVASMVLGFLPTAGQAAGPCGPPVVNAVACEGAEDAVQGAARSTGAKSMTASGSGPITAQVVTLRPK